MWWKAVATKFNGKRDWRALKRKFVDISKDKDAYGHSVVARLKMLVEQKRAVKSTTSS